MPNGCILTYKTKLMKHEVSCSFFSTPLHVFLIWGCRKMSTVTLLLQLNCWCLDNFQDYVHTSPTSVWINFTTLLSSCWKRKKRKKIKLILYYQLSNNIVSCSGGHITFSADECSMKRFILLYPIKQSLKCTSDIIQLLYLHFSPLLACVTLFLVSTKRSNYSLPS